MTRRGTSAVAGQTSVCTSATSGRRPSSVTVTQVPGTGSASCDRNSPLGSGRPISPNSPSSKQPISSVGPYRFFSARIIRSGECRSPSKCRTTSTRCSSERGPAIEPSLVTWPTSTVVSIRCLARLTSAEVISRTWVTPPGVPSMPAAEMVCTESTISSAGSTASTCASSAARSVSAARKSFALIAPIRSARSLTWAADSSPVTYSTGPRSAASAPASSSSVDLPTPGSPASSATVPGTRPPPSTRSSSSMPVGRAAAALASISEIGTAGAAGRRGGGPGPAAAARPGRAAAAGDLDLGHRAPGLALRRTGRPTASCASRTLSTGTAPGGAFAMSERVTAGPTVHACPAQLAGVSGMPARRYIS